MGVNPPAVHHGPVLQEVDSEPAPVEVTLYPELGLIAAAAYEHHEVARDPDPVDVEHAVQLAVGDGHGPDLPVSICALEHCQISQNSTAVIALGHRGRHWRPVPFYC